METIIINNHTKDRGMTSSKFCEEKEYSFMKSYEKKNAVYLQVKGWDQGRFPLHSGA